MGFQCRNQKCMGNIAFHSKCEILQWYLPLKKRWYIFILFLFLQIIKWKTFYLLIYHLSNLRLMEWSDIYYTLLNSRSNYWNKWGDEGRSFYIRWTSFQIGYGRSGVVGWGRIHNSGRQRSRKTFALVRKTGWKKILAIFILWSLWNMT